MQSEKSQEVLGYFDAIARRYDVMNTLLSFGLHHRWKRTAVARAGLTHGSSVLDVCGGTADLAIRAARLTGTQGRVVVYDFSREMIKAGRQKTAAGTTIRFVCGDAHQMSFKKYCFDTALIGFGLRNLQHIPRGLDQINRILKPGGRLVCLEFSQPVTPWFRWLYDRYSRYVIPVMGKLITGSRDAYAYLPDSIRKFPLPNELATLMAQAGFADVHYTRLLNGIAAIHVGVKRGDQQ